MRVFTPRGGSLGSHPRDVGQVYRYDTRLLDKSHQTSVKCLVTLGDLEGMQDSGWNWGVSGRDEWDSEEGIE